MRARTLAKRQRELRAQLLEAATRLLPTAEKAAEAGRPQLLRTIVAISRSADTTEQAKTRLELTAEALEMRGAIEREKLDRSDPDREPTHVDVEFDKPDD